MTDLETRIREHYRDARLSEASIRRIQSGVSPRATPPRVWYARLGAVAAGLLVGFGVLHLYVVERDVTTRVLAEVAMNHTKQLDLEFVADDVVSIAQAMNRLDVPLQPSGIWPARYVLLGGRYCSIQGGLAGQLKLRDRDTGEVHTLYATRLTADLERAQNSSAVHDSVGITLWSDQNVFFALAGGTTPPTWQK